MKIANVIYEKELINHKNVDYINYYNKPIEYNTLYKTLPTLYVGWSFMKLSNPDNEIIKNADILKKRIITNELYWECSFEEGKSSHVRGVDSFVNLAPQFYFTPKYSYINLDPIFFQIKDVQDLLDILPKKMDALYNYKNEMLYLLLENKIWGINLDIFGFYKFNTNDILSSISEKTNKIHNDLDGNTYQSQYKIFPNFTQLKRFLITILEK